MVTLSPELKALLTQAAEGDADAEYEVGMRYLEGDGCGITQNNRKAFRSFLSAACKGSPRAMGELSRSYGLGRGIRRDHRESYIWALLAKSRCKGLFTAEYLQSLESQLSADTLERAQEEAEKRSELLAQQALTPDYCLESSANAEPRGLRPEDRNVRAIYLPDIKPLTLPGVEAVPAPAKTEPDPEDDDPEPSEDIAYKYLKACKRRFDPAKVTLELIVPRKLFKDETMDFTRLRIRYDGRNTDIKDTFLLNKYRIYKAHRVLLIRLAAQYSLTDPEQRAQNIHGILADSSLAPLVSRLNNLFAAIFPGCSKQRKNKMINRQSGLVSVRLKVDTTNLVSAADYHTCQVIPHPQNCPKS